ncbi:MAG: mechanosensitive ion channel [Burkholderiaceae bacterium]|jgi:small-conductance mechanosensitive channel|nr:mechanosensitive ion channel [Burkholderiaceae bacterium]
MTDFLQRLARVGIHSLAIELAVLALCIAAAWIAVWAITWGVRRRVERDPAQEPGAAGAVGGSGITGHSILLGRRIIDGLLFPLLALLLTDLARNVLQDVMHQPILLLRVAVSVFLSLSAIRLMARVLSAVFPTSKAVRVIERTVSWLAWLGSVLWITGLLPTVLDEFDKINLSFGKTHVSLGSVLGGALSASLVLVIALWISATIERRLLASVSDLSMGKVASNTVRAFLLLIGLLFALSAAGVDLSVFSVLGGALGVGLGFGLQKLAANYVSGFVILLERSVRIGDNVRVDTFEGRVTDIKTRYTLIRASNGREAIVPNELLITSRVENLTQADRKFKLATSIVVGCDSPVAQVQAILCAAALAQKRVLRDPAPMALLTSFAPDGIEFTLNFWIADPATGYAALQSAVNVALLEGLRAAGIDIPFPQRVLRIERGNALGDK